jgi:hypothetical protein
MDPKELRGLMEAYSEVYAPQQIDELSNRKLRAYIKKSGKSHAEINKKWDQGTATDKEKSKSIGHEIGQHRAFKTLDKRTRKEDFEFWVDSLIEEGYDLSEYTWDEMFDIYEAEGSYGETPKAYSAASRAKMTAKRKPFLKAMQRRTNPANRTDSYGSPRKGMTASDREEARAGAAYGSPRGHDYPSQGPGGVTKNPKKLRKQKAMGEFAKEDFDIFDTVLEFLCAEGYVETLEEAEWLMANELDVEDIEAILEAEGSYGETPKAYSAASKTKMTAKRKPFLKAMLRRTNPANRKDAYASPRKGLTADDRERARAGSAHGVGTRQDHDYPSQGPGGVTRSAKKLRKQKAMGEHD